MKLARYAAPLMVCLLGAMIGCVRQAEPPPVEPREPAAEVFQPESAYYYFLAAQDERRHGKIDQAILSIRKAIELDPDSAYLQRELATIFLQNKEELNALAVLEGLLAKHPQDVHGLILYGGIRQVRKENRAAIEAYEKVLQLDPSQEKIYPLLGNLYLEAGELDSAERVLNRLLNNFPDSYTGHFLLGRVNLAKKQTALAQQHFTRSAELDPDSLEPLFELFKIAREQGNKNEMLRINREILERDPGNSRALMELALFYRQARMRSDADAILKDLGEKSATSFEPVLQVIQLYVEPKQYDDALFLVNGMLNGAPQSPDLHYLKGFSLFAMKKSAEALKEFRLVTPESRFYQDAVVHLAFVLQEQGKNEEALAQLKEAEAKSPENADLKYYIATLYEEIGQFAEAEGYLKKALEKDPDNTRYYFRLGVVYDKQNNKDACIEAMRKVIALDPKHAEALNYLGYTYADLGQNLEEAEQLIREALTYKPNDGYITDSLGWVYYKKGDYPKALQVLKKAAELVPEDPTIMEHIGDTYLKLNDKPNALKYYQKSLLKKEKDKDELQRKIKRIKDEGR
jgi:tetratricopeptide (TPR) repeat protein